MSGIRPGSSGPYYEDLEPGWTFESDGYSLSAGHVAWFQALAGDQNPTHVDFARARSAGWREAPVNTALVAHVAIGQSTRATREVIANLFYRSALFSRPVEVGSTLRTRVEVVGRTGATPRADRPARGKVMLGMTTVDDDENEVFAVQRCALVRCAAADSPPPMSEFDELASADMAVGRFDPWRPLLPPSSQGRDWSPGEERFDHLLEPVDDALGLVRLTGNEARAHRDSSQGQLSRRLVYGGHTLSLAQAALSRLVDDVHVVAGWHGCTHPAPVFEGDHLHTSATLLDRSLVKGVDVASFEVRTTARRDDGTVAEVQRWTPVVIMAPAAGQNTTPRPV